MDIARLFEVQKLDLNMEKLRRRAQQIKQAQGESAELKEARAASLAAEEQLHHWHAAQKDAELEAQALTQRIQESETLLMSGKVRHAKELESLQDSIVSLQRHHVQVEEAGVEAMLQVESATAQVDAAHSLLKTVEEGWRGGQAELTQEETKVKRLYAQFKQQRATTAEGIDPAALTLYESLRERRAGIALAPIRNGMCGVCHVQLPTGVVSAARNRHDEATYCPSCGRLLYAGLVDSRLAGSSRPRGLVHEERFAGRHSPPYAQREMAGRYRLCGHVTRTGMTSTCPSESLW